MDFQLSEEQTLLRDTTRDDAHARLRSREPTQGPRHRARLEPRGVGPAGRGRRARARIRRGRRRSDRDPRRARRGRPPVGAGAAAARRARPRCRDRRGGQRRAARTARRGRRRRAAAGLRPHRAGNASAHHDGVDNRCASRRFVDHQRPQESRSWLGTVPTPWWSPRPCPTAAPGCSWSTPARCNAGPSARSTVSVAPRSISTGRPPNRSARRWTPRRRSSGRWCGSPRVCAPKPSGRWRRRCG